ncbi:MAG TPA: hypothetical protein VJ966_14090, partial [Actinomycetes bacterium]|nr:hypothetical protein [Actinomycetes bacterium]
AFVTDPLQPQPAQPPAQAQIPPQPLPTRVDVNPAEVRVPGQPVTHVLRWDVTTPAGQTTFFTDRDFVQDITRILMGHLQAWPAELVVPTLDLSEVRRELDQPNGTRRG